MFSFRHKTKNNIQNLSFIRLFLAILLLFIPPVLEFSVIHQHVEPDVLFFVLLLPLQLRFLSGQEEDLFQSNVFRKCLLFAITELSLLWLDS